MNPKRFAQQNKIKKLDQKKFLTNQIQNKENIFGVGQSNPKQFSVDLHRFSQEKECKQRSILNEDISVGLQLKQNKTFAFEKLYTDYIEHDLLELTQLLQQRVRMGDGNTIKILRKKLQNDEIHAPKMRDFISLLLGSLHCGGERLDSMSNMQEQQTDEIVCFGTMLHEKLREQVNLLEKNYQKLHEKSIELKAISAVEKEQRDNIKNMLKKISQQQQKQILDLCIL